MANWRDGIKKFNTMVSRIRRLFWISRPRFWWYLAGPFLVGSVYGVDNLNSLIQSGLIVGFAYWLTLANFWLYGVNDLADGDTDQYNPKKGSKEIRLNDSLTISDLKTALVIVLISGWGLVAWFGFSWWLFLFWLILSVGYSLPPLRWKARPVWDSLSNSLYFLPGIISYQWLSGQWSSIEIVMAAIAWTAAMQLFSAIPDIEADRKAGLHTTACWLGQSVSLLVCGGLWLLAVGLIMPVFNWWWLGMIYPLMVGWVLLNKSKNVDKVYWYFPWINTLIGFVIVFSRLLNLKF